MKRRNALLATLMAAVLFASNAAAQTSKLVPARDTLENLGFVTEWDAETKTAVFKNDGHTVSVKSGDDGFEVDGKKITFENAVYEEENITYNVPVIIGGSFYLPDTELMQAIGANEPEEVQEVQEVQSEKHLDLKDYRLKDIEGITNARQLGGYVNKNGRVIKQNVIIRTGKPSDGTENDFKLLSEKYKVSDMVDFRTENETKTAPEPTIEGAKNHHIPLNIAGDMSALATDEFMQAYAKASQSGDKGEILVLLAENKMLPTPQMYRNYFLGDEAAAGYKEFFNILLNKPEDASVLFHCTQGKDRTGMGSALFLYALDFDDEVVMEDYLLTNEANKAVIEADIEAVKNYTDDAETIELAKMMDGVDAPCLQAVIDDMNEQYGSVKGYLKEKIGLTDDDFAKLEKLYLE
ncbi:MAG: tyrosine-protein phosphatase [Firmicutes bacterium]|nr:tyrosine-protein phosphatase [Bacillota bacterium]